MVTLDGESELEASDLVITVADKPVALAGVMGGGYRNLEKSTRVVLDQLSSMANRSAKTSGRSIFVLKIIFSL